ncbi:hypothetical protein DFQ28_008720 [Apophysomyces sp. BC1034]|nr:hypothetical protein DFQ30_008532 [Apophysomyces sp. BC1015]KAG0175803.1 hypothetical protein DFQ29_006995 [Apophysomyces sp. BC1021]KAG0185828.1 hypothetical protein DFQ28_008720 [Apophysomyces sp. BC1034]
MFLPTDAAVQAAVASNLLNFSNPKETMDMLMYHILPDIYNSTVLQRQQQYITTLNVSGLVIGPADQDQTMVEIKGGVTTANIVVKDLNCSNGILHVVDHVLQPPHNIMDTISELPELESYELLLKQLNLTTLVSQNNKTVLAPINKAWIAANGSNMPFGILVHNVKYQVIDGIYLSSQLFAKDGTMLQTNYDQSTVTFSRTPDGKKQVIGNNLNDSASIVRTDVITANGVIHLIDTVLLAERPTLGTVAGPTKTSDYWGTASILLSETQTPRPRSHASTPAIPFRILWTLTICLLPFAL